MRETGASYSRASAKAVGFISISHCKLGTDLNPRKGAGWTGGGGLLLESKCKGQQKSDRYLKSVIFLLERPQITWMQIKQS